MKDIILMKKNFLFFFICSLFLVTTSNTLHSQRFLGGVVGGFNLSQIDGDLLQGYNQVGFNVGARVATVLSNKWQLSLEFLFAQQGSNRSTSDNASGVFEDIRLNFVEVPVMINFLDWKFHASAGVSYARLMSFSATDFTGVDISDTQNYNPDVFFFVIGATFFFNEHVGLNVKWSKSFNSFQGDEGGNSLISRVITVRGVYMF